MSATTAPANAASALLFGDPQLHADGDVLALAFALDGSLWSVEEPGLARHWDAATGKPLGWHFLSDLETLWAFSGDAGQLASANEDVSVWDTAAGRLVTRLPQSSWV